MCGMDAATIVIVLVAFFASAFLKGITGLGFSTLCLGMLASVIDMKLAIPLMLIPSLSSNVLVMRDAGGFRESLARFWPLFLAALPGLALGLWLLDTVESGVSRSVLGVVLLVYGLWSLARATPAVPPALRRWAEPPVGFLTGVVNGLTGSQVMPVLPYLLGLGLPTHLFVQTINISFTLSSLVMLAGLSGIGLLTREVVLISAMGIVPVALGIRLGGVIRRRLPEETFKRLVLVLLVVLGASLMLRAVWSW